MARPFVGALSSWCCVAALFAAGCGDGMTDMPEPGPPAALTVSPPGGRLTFLDETLQLTATARDGSGREVGDVAFTWTSSDPSILTVDATGLVTAVKGGRADITVEAEGLSTTTTLTVTGPSDLAYLEADWTGEAVLYDEGGMESMSVAGSALAVVGGEGSRLDLVVGSGTEARELVALGRTGGTGVRLGLADGYRGTFVVSDGSFDGLGSLSLDSGTRLGDGRVERIRMEAFREASFDLLVDGSEDGGASWAPVWIFHLQKATDAPPPPTERSPACTAERYADFDFWKGDWNVTQGGSPSGTNRVEPLAAMCGIQENWTSVGGGTGMSLNMFDPRSGKWTQLWVDSGGLVLELRGGLSSGSMLLEGPRNPSGTILDRVRWTPNPDGTVRQLWETNTAGAGWVTSFDGLYHPTG